MRELENTLEHAAVYARGAVIAPEDLPEKIVWHSRTVERENQLHAMVEDFPTLDELERRYLGFVLDAFDGSRTRAAAVMGIDREQ